MTDSPIIPTSEQLQRREALLAFLRTLPPEKFDFHEVVKRYEDGCGTVCCALGWTPELFPSLVLWEEEPSIFGEGLRIRWIGLEYTDGPISIAKLLFGLDTNACRYAFVPDQDLNRDVPEQDLVCPYDAWDHSYDEMPRAGLDATPLQALARIEWVFTYRTPWHLMPDQVGTVRAEWSALRAQNGL